MNTFTVGQTVIIKVNIDGVWRTKGQRAVIIDIQDGAALVQPVIGYFEPIVDESRRRSLWAALRWLKGTRPMPISPIFLQEAQS